MDPEGGGDAVGHPGMARHRFLHEARDVLRGMSPRSQHIRVYRDISGTCRDTVGNSLLNAWLRQLHVRNFHNIPGVLLGHQRGDRLQKLVGFFESASMVDKKQRFLGRGSHGMRFVRRFGALRLFAQDTAE